jgi:fibronectin-binding autotransporter adhesin
MIRAPYLAPCCYPRKWTINPAARLRILACLAIAASSPVTPSVLAANVYWDGTGTGWNSATSWSTLSNATTPDPANPPGSTDVAVFSTSNVVLTQTVGLNAAQSALGLVFNSAAPHAFQTGSGTNTLTIGTSGITVNAGTGTVTISPLVILGGAQTWANNSVAPFTAGNLALGSNALTMSGAGAGGFTFTGALSGASATLTVASGSTTLSGTSANTYTGSTTVNGGTLTLNKTIANSAIPANLVIGDGLGGANADVVSISSSNQISDTSAVTINTSGLLQCLGAQEYISTLTMNGGNITTPNSGSISLGVLNTNANANVATITGNFNLNGTTTANVAVGTTASGIDLDIQAAVTNGTLTKNGAGVMRLSGSVDNAGSALNVAGGTALLAKPSGANVHAIAGSLSIAGGTAQLAGSGSDQIQNSATVTAGAALAAGTFDTHGQNENFAVLNLFGNGIGNNGALLNSTGASVLTVPTATNLTADSSIGVASGAGLTLDSPIVGSYGLTKAGAGTLTLTGSGINAYTGTTTVSGGVLVLSKTVVSSAVPGNVVITTGSMRLGAEHQINDASTINVSAGGSFDCSTFKESIAKVVFNGGSITGSTGEFRVTSPDGLTTTASSTTATISGPFYFDNVAGSTIDVSLGTTPSGVDLDVTAAMTWTGTITKAGAGTMRISGPNFSAPGFTLNGGALLVANNSALGAGTLTFSSGTIAADGAARSVSNPVVVPAAANATFNGSYDLTLTGAVSGAGRLTKAGTSTLTLNGTNTLAGPVNINTGTLALSGGSLSANIVNSASFVYNGGTFSGRLTNAGTTTFNADFAVGNGLENDATFAVPLGRVITLAGAGLDNEGSLNMAGGTLNLSTSPSAANVNRGTFNLSSAFPFNLNGATLSNNGTFNLNSGTVLGTTGLLTNGVGGAIAGSGAILSPFANAGGLVVVGSGTTNINQPFSNAGYIQLTSATANLNGGLITSSGSIDGIGAIGNNITNIGTIEALGGTLTLGGSVTNTAPGRILAATGARVLLTGTAANSGNINLNGGTIEFTQAATNAASGAISGHGTLITGGDGLTNSGTISFTSGISDVFGKLSNSTGLSTKGLIVSAGAGALFWHDVTNSAGSLFRVSNGATATFFGTYAGAGITGGGQVNFQADVAPGFSPASDSFAGNVTMAPTARLIMELGGTVPGTGFDQIQVAGALTLDGALQVSLLNGFTPMLGNSFDLLDWGSVTGTFSSLQLPAIPADLQWNTTQLYATGTISVASVALPGDFNNNGTVDASDYITWRKELGTTYAQGDYNIWRSRLGQSSAAGASHTAAVPECPSLILITQVIAAVSLRKNRRRKTG